MTRRLKEMPDSFVDGVKFEDYEPHDSPSISTLTATHPDRREVKITRRKKAGSPASTLLSEMAMALWVSGDDAYEDDSADFSGHPETVGELRANKTRNAKNWTPRDALIMALREIDSGKIKPTVLVVAFLHIKDECEPSGASTGYYVSSPSIVHTAGCMSMVSNDLVADTANR